MWARISLPPLRVASVALAGCGDNGTGPGAPGLGSASVQITGAVSQSFSGMAVFGSDVLGSGHFVIWLEDHTATADVGFLRTSGGRLTPGTYALSAFDAPIYAEVAVTQGGQHHFFVSTGGQLTITASSAQSVQGTASFQAVGEFGGPGEIQVTASFDATCFPVPGAMHCD